MNDIMPVKFDVCGDDLSGDFIETKSNIYGNGIIESRKVNYIGMSISLNGKHPEITKVRQNFGRAKFFICYSCWLKQLGVRDLFSGLVKVDGGIQ